MLELSTTTKKWNKNGKLEKLVSTGETEEEFPRRDGRMRQDCKDQSTIKYYNFFEDKSLWYYNLNTNLKGIFK